jgi:hypothetical protein
VAIFQIVKYQVSAGYKKCGERLQIKISVKNSR